MIVLDTNVVSEAMRQTPDPGVARWLNSQSVETLYLQSVTIAELKQGIDIKPTGRAKDRLQTSFDILVALFKGRILAFDHDAAMRYARMAYTARQIGRPLPISDGYIAAIAAAHGFAVATRNTRHFADTGVRLINPWSE